MLLSSSDTAFFPGVGQDVETSPPWLPTDGSAWVARWKVQHQAGESCEGLFSMERFFRIRSASVLIVQNKMSMFCASSSIAQRLPLITAGRSLTLVGFLRLDCCFSFCLAVNPSRIICTNIEKSGDRCQRELGWKCREELTDDGSTNIRTKSTFLHQNICYSLA